MPVPAGPIPNVMSCSWMSFRYRVWFGVRPCRSARRVRRSGAGIVVDDGRRVLLRRELDQAELDVVDGQRLFGGRIEALQRQRRARRVRGKSGQREIGAAMRDRDVERSLDLPQIRVERATQVGERAVVERRQRESCRSRLAVMSRSCRRAPSSSNALPDDRCLQRLFERARRFDQVRSRSGVAVAARRGGLMLRRELLRLLAEERSRICRRR